MATYKTFSETITTGNNTHTINGEAVGDTTMSTVIIINDGTGDINIRFDLGEGVETQTHVMKPTDPPLEIKETVQKIRIIHSGTDASYRILVY